MHIKPPFQKRGPKETKTWEKPWHHKKNFWFPPWHCTGPTALLSLLRTHGAKPADLELKEPRACVCVCVCVCTVTGSPPPLPLPPSPYVLSVIPSSLFPRCSKSSSSSSHSQIARQAKVDSPTISRQNCTRAICHGLVGVVAARGVPVALPRQPKGACLPAWLYIYIYTAWEENLYEAKVNFVLLALLKDSKEDLEE